MGDYGQSYGWREFNEKNEERFIRNLLIGWEDTRN
jgi:hypothetical protein